MFALPDSSATSIDRSFIRLRWMIHLNADETSHSLVDRSFFFEIKTNHPHTLRTNQVIFLSSEWLFVSSVRRTGSTLDMFLTGMNAIGARHLIEQTGGIKASQSNWSHRGRWSVLGENSPTINVRSCFHRTGLLCFDRKQSAFGSIIFHLTYEHEREVIVSSLNQWHITNPTAVI